MTARPVGSLPSLSSLAIFLLLTPVVVAVSGCHGHGLPIAAAEEARASARAEQNALLNTEREQMAMIPPPAKSRFMAVRTYEAWENPWITVQPDMVTLHVLLADAIPQAGAGGMLRPINARRQDLNLSLDKLNEAVTSIPQSSWPYGRVIAVEEAHKTPPAGEPAVRRSLQGAVGRLNDLGVVVYDLNEGTIR